jgi:membrane protein
MKLSAKDAFQLLKKSAQDFGEDECPTSAAALAYSTVFALPPLLILILMLVSSFVSREQVQNAMSGQFGAMLGQDGRKMLMTMLTQAKQPGGGPIGTILGLVALVLGATGAFMQLQGALNRAWEVKPDPKAGGIKNFIFKRVLSIGMVLVIAFLLLVSLALSAALTAVGGAIGHLIPGASSVVVGILQTLVSLVVVTLLFGAIFKVLPDATISWRDVWVGALVTALLFEIGKWAIGLYLGNSNPGKAYGAAGSLAVLLVWIYYTAMIVLFGAEFTETWATERGSGIEPEEGAMWREDSAHAEETKKKGDAGASAARAREPAAPRTPASRELAAQRAAKAAEQDRDPDASPENQSGRPGGGVGRREAVGGSGIHPVSAGTAPGDADARTPGTLARRDEDDDSADDAA